MNKSEFADKLQEIRKLVDDCLRDLGEDSKKQSATVKKKRKTPDNTGKDYILEIVNKIKTCKESEVIDTSILDKSNVPNRILLPFYICYKYFPDQSLTSGDIGKITSQLRIRVQVPNVSKNITKSLLKYLEGDSTRVKGKAVAYKLNRRGAKHFESILQENEDK